MASCGTYDFAGQWLHDVGMPAKSGVGGGILAVVPGRLGIAVYSPPLDSLGNSVRGIAVCGELSERLGLSLFNQYPQSGSTVRRSYTAALRQSRRWRSPPTGRPCTPQASASASCMPRASLISPPWSDWWPNWRRAWSKRGCWCLIWPMWWSFRRSRRGCWPSS